MINTLHKAQPEQLKMQWQHPLFLAQSSFFTKAHSRIVSWMILALLAICLPFATHAATENLTGNWTDIGGNQFQSTTTNGTTVTVSTVTTAPAIWNGVSTGTMTLNDVGVNVFTNADVYGRASLSAVYRWDSTPDTGADIDLPSDDQGNGITTFTFSQPVENPIIYFDRNGGIGGGVSNSTLITLNDGLTWTELAGTAHFDSTGTTLERTPDVNLNAGIIGECTSTVLDGTACGTMQINGIVSSFSFTWIGVGVEGAGGDGIEIVIEALPPAPTITKDHNDADSGVMPGDTFSYTVIIDNPVGGQTLTGITIDDALPAGVTYVAQSTVATGPIVTTVTSPGSYLDQFSVRAYNNSNGLTLWTSSWVEVEDNGGGATAGEIQVNSSGGDLRLQDLDTGNSISREVDLSIVDASQPVIFSWNSELVFVNGSAESIAAQLFVAGTWVTVDTANATGSESHTLTAAQIAGTTAIRFITNSGAWGGTERFDIDNVQITFTEITTTSTVTTLDNIPAGANGDLVDGVPSNLVETTDGFQLASGETLTVIYQVTVDVGATPTIITNTASFNSSELTAAITDSSSLQFVPTAATIGEINLSSVLVDTLLTQLGINNLSDTRLLELLLIWDADSAAALTDANRPDILNALKKHLDPDRDGKVAELRWDTLEERGTIGFYVERRNDEGDWQRINNDLLPGLISAPMGGEYLLIDPRAISGQTYEYQLIELEATGITRTYGPYLLDLE